MIGYRSKYTIFFVLILSMVGVVACFNEDDYNLDKIAAIEWDPSYAIKFLHGELSINDFEKDLKDFDIRTDPDGLLYFYYESYNESDSLTGIVEFSDVSANASFNSMVNFVGSLNEELLVVDDTFVIDLGLSGGQIDSVFYEMLGLDIIFGCTANLGYELTFTFPTFLEEGVPITRTYTRTTNDPIANQRLDQFTGFLADLTQDDPPYNHFPIAIQAKLLPASNVTITQADFFEFKFDISNQDFNWIVGYFEPQSRGLSDEDLSIDIFDRNFEGEYGLEGTKMSFEIEHDFGVPIRLAFNTLQASNSEGAVLPIEIDPVSPIDINYPTVLGTSARDLITVTNASDIFNFKPDGFQYQVEAFVNEGIGDGRNFLADTSKARVKFIAEIPLWGYASGIVLQDTVQIDLQGLSEDGVEIDPKAAYLKTLITNGYPVDIAVQAVMLDENFLIIDSLLRKDQTLLVKAALTNDTGIQEEGVFDGEIELEEQKLDALFDATYMIVIGRLRTFTNTDGSQPNVKFFEQANVSVDMGLRTDLNIKVKP